MKRKSRWKHYLRVAAFLTAVLCALAASVHAQNPGNPSPADRQPAVTIDYEKDVRPILAARCFGCHGPKHAQSGRPRELRQNALRGGDDGVVLVPGKSAESKLVHRLT